MKKYYIHNGTEQEGPFELDELKTKNITKSTSIWYDGLSDWTSAEKIAEIKVLFNTTAPPPFSSKLTVPPPIQKKAIAQQQTKKKRKVGLTIFLIVVGLIALIICGLFVAKNLNLSSGSSSRTGGNNYQEKVMSVEEIERSQPTNFLTADGKYNQNFWGDKIKVHGVITNTATIASYKDAVVKVTYYSKTNTDLGNNTYTIYDNFPPHSVTKFELTIENYKNVNSIGWNVINAKPN